MTTQFSHPQRQQGAALMVCLILLVVVTITGLAAASSSTLQLTMANGASNRNLSFQAAESALREAEQRIARMKFGCGMQDVLPPDGGSRQVPLVDGGFVTIWDSNAASRPDPFDADSWAKAEAYSHQLAGIGSTPRYRIELLDSEAASNYATFRITAAAQANRGARTVVEAQFRRSFTRTVHIRGLGDNNVIALGDGIVTARAAFGTVPELDISLGGWSPNDCDDDGAPVTLVYEGTGGTDVFVVADILGLGYAPGINGMLDLTSSVTGLQRALADYRIEKVLVENPGTTAVAISTLDVSGRFTSDNRYCINTGTADAENDVLDQLATGLLGALLPATPLDDIVSAVANAGNAIVGPGGLLPVLPASASIIIDGGGDDRYEIHADTTLAAMVIADLGGNDEYHLQATGDGFLNQPVILDIGGSDSRTVRGGNSQLASLNAGALSDLEALLNAGGIGGLLDNLGAVVQLLYGGSCGGGGLLGGLLCSLLNTLSGLLGDILDAVTGLFSSEVKTNTDPVLSYSAGQCANGEAQRISWRERYQ